MEYFKSIDARQWWVAVVGCGMAALIAALAAKEREAVVIAVGVVVWSFGEWIQHPFQTTIVPGAKITGYKRKFKWFGALLNVVGLGLIGFGIYQLVKGP